MEGKSDFSKPDISKYKTRHHERCPQRFHFRIEAKNLSNAHVTVQFRNKKESTFFDWKPCNTHNQRLQASMPNKEHERK